MMCTNSWLITDAEIKPNTFMTQLKPRQKHLVREKL